MARHANLDNPLVAWRQIVRRLRDGERLAEDPGYAALRDSIEIALFRVPARQRAVVTRYDLGGEPASEIQRALGLSARQFFRDRRAALTKLRVHLPSLTALQPASLQPSVHASARSETAAPCQPMTDACDATLLARASARNLAQTGNEQCLGILRDLAGAASDMAVRVELLLEVAELALDFDDERTARAAVKSAAQFDADMGRLAPGLAEYFFGRRARSEGRLEPSYLDAAAKFTEAAARLRRSLGARPDAIDAQAALSETLGDLAVLDFEAGNFASARTASAEAAHIIETFNLWTRPRALEIMAMDADLDACLSGRMTSATATVGALLRRAVDSSWPATASRLGADIIGLYGASGDCGSALRWYASVWPVALKSARPRDRWSLTAEAAGSYAGAGRARDALAILSRAKDSSSCPSSEMPARHAFVASCLLQIGENAKALDAAHAALTGYTARCMGRGMGDAHRLVAKSHARLGHLAAAREHIGEARRLSERYGMPEGLLCTLTAQAEIQRSPAVRADARELQRILRRLAGG